MTCIHFRTENGVAVLSLSNPPLNPLSSELLEHLDAALERALSDQEVLAIVLEGADHTFAAGADIRRLQQLAQRAAQPSVVHAETGPQLVPDGNSPGGLQAPKSLGQLAALVEGSPKPVIAAIDGFALGGGLELALSCHGRLATPGAKLGLPELKLGLIPGAGGTQRLARLVGLEAALELQLSSRQVSAREARELGLVDSVVDQGQLLSQAITSALALAAPGALLRRTSQLRDRIEQGAAAQALADSARLKFKRLFRHVKFPELCVDANLTGALYGAERGLLRERECFEECLREEAAQGLIHLFFAARSAAKVPGLTDLGLTPRRLSKAGVIGGGTMGSGIAASLLSRGYQVTLIERDTHAGEQARARVTAAFAQATKGASSAEPLAGLSIATDIAALGQVELVVEAATEDLALKRALFARLLEVCPADTVLASNTSTLALERIAEGLPGGGRIIGAHFFSPAHVMPLLEVVRTPDSPPQALVDLLGVARQLKKTSVVVGSQVGFLVNRAWMPYTQAAGLLIDRGVDPYELDRVVTAFGMPMGPCRVSDLVGVDVGVFAGAILDAAYPARAYRSPLRRLLVAAGRLGEKAGAGHYAYPEGKPQADPALRAFVDASRAEMGNPTPLELDSEDIIELLVFLVVNEACRVLEEGHAQSASDVDLALHLGMGFPGFRGGPMKWADRKGARYVAERLRGWQAETGLGLFEPSERLAQRAKTGASVLE